MPIFFLTRSVVDNLLSSTAAGRAPWTTLDPTKSLEYTGTVLQTREKDDVWNFVKNAYAVGRRRCVSHSGGSALPETEILQKHAIAHSKYVFEIERQRRPNIRSGTIDYRESCVLSKISDSPIRECSSAKHLNHHSQSPSP